MGLATGPSLQLEAMEAGEARQEPFSSLAPSCPGPTWR